MAISYMGTRLYPFNPKDYKDITTIKASRLEFIKRQYLKAMNRVFDNTEDNNFRIKLLDEIRRQSKTSP